MLQTLPSLRKQYVARLLVRPRFWLMVAVFAAASTIILLAPSWRVGLWIGTLTSGVVGWQIWDAVRRTAAALRRELRPGPEADDYQRLCSARKQYLVPVRQPLVLISQVQRSGGTLLSQLFDSHPQCHAHPHELYTGYPEKTTWPLLDLNGDPEDWFRMLFETPAAKAFQRGYSKYAQGVDEGPEHFPFLFPPTLQHSLFRHCVEGQRPKSQRDVFDCFFTSYFNAWLDNHNLYNGPKKYVTAFVPRLAMEASHVARFFAVYPDGRLVAVVRDPRTWYVSARRYRQAYQDLPEAISLWKASTRAALDAKARYGSSVCVVSFTDLLTDTARVMHRLADDLGIGFHTSLLTPTFNGQPIKADSSFKVQEYGVLTAPLRRAESELTAAEIDFIDRQTVDVYATAIAAADGYRMAA